MKFHALTLCLAGAMIAGPVFADDDRTVTDRTVQHESTHYYSAGSYYPPQYMYLREEIYADLPSEREVAMKVRTIVEKQLQEAADLRSIAPAAQTAGFSNIATVYEHMANDHLAVADFGRDWLTDRGFDAPAMPTVTTTAVTEPVASVDHQMDMHLKAFNDALAMRKGERSSTVRTLALWAATGAARHISLLQVLDRDVEFGRKTVSARLQSLMDGDLVASERTALVDRIIAEEMEMYRVTTTTPETVVTEQPVIEHVVEVERPVVVEKIVEKPVVVEKIVEKPVYVERIVEKPVYITRPQVRSTVAGRRQTVRSRRPAK